MNDKPVVGFGARDQTEIPAVWTFKDRSVAENFETHVRGQLPWYDHATWIVQHFGRHYLPQGGRMYDLGASTGNITNCLKDEIESREVEAVSIDNSEQMKEQWRGVGQFVVADVETYSYEKYDFGVCFLLLMFLAPAKQRQLLHTLVQSIAPGGCLIVFDKTDQFEGYLSTVVHRLTMAGKVKTGVDPEDIIKKELSLAGIQRPIRPDQLLFREHNAKEIFRFGEFCGYAFVN